MIRASKDWQLPIAIACILLGVLVALQMRAQATASQQSTEPQPQRQLLEMFKAMEAERNKLALELSQTRERIAEIEEAASRRESTVNQIKDQLDQARVQAGLMAMTGPGVVVELVDSNRKPALDEDPYFYIVHDVDLQALVNELWAAGAEAIAVNGQRLVTRTSIRCVGPTVLVNAVRLASPYEVRAIGPARTLEDALRMPGGFLDSMDPLLANGGQIRITAQEAVTVPAYEGSLVYRYARPLTPSERATLP